MLTDTHCHLDDPALRSRLDEVMAAARQAGVRRIIVPGVEPAGWDAIASLAREHEGIYPAFGIHPQAADQAHDDALGRLASLAGTAVAVGEIGLDHLLSHPPRLVQEKAFREQLRIAVAAGSSSIAAGPSSLCSASSGRRGSPGSAGSCTPFPEAWRLPGSASGSASSYPSRGPSPIATP